jgi:hypothetical protein
MVWGRLDKGHNLGALVSGRGIFDTENIYFTIVIMIQDFARLKDIDLTAAQFASLTQACQVLIDGPRYGANLNHGLSFANGVSCLVENCVVPKAPSA